MKKINYYRVDFFQEKKSFFDNEQTVIVLNSIYLKDYNKIDVVNQLLAKINANCLKIIRVNSITETTEEEYRRWNND